MNEADRHELKALVRYWSQKIKKELHVHRVLRSHKKK